MIRQVVTTAALSLITFPAVCEELSGDKLLFDARATFHEQKKPVKERYRNALAELVSRADRVEVCILDFETQPADTDLLGRLKEDQFPIAPYGAQSKVLYRKILNSAELAALRPALNAALSTKETSDGALCHFPIHGVRAWVRDSLVFEASFCWKCKNFAVDYPDKPEWMNLSNANLEQVLNRILPIPPSELERFEKRYPSKDSK